LGQDGERLDFAQHARPQADGARAGLERRAVAQAHMDRPKAHQLSRIPNSHECLAFVRDLYVSERARLVELAFHVTQNRSDAEDVVQTTFVRAVERAFLLPSVTSWPAWLVTVTRRIAIDTLRMAKRQQRADVELDALSPREVDPWAQPSLESKSRGKSLPDALSLCHPALYQTFELWYVHGQSYKQIAEQLQLTVSTVGTRLHRIKRHLRRQLKISTNSRSRRAQQSS
jgi:RNA polymerase sigma-70 factor (ECF subfamily)